VQVVEANEVEQFRDAIAGVEVDYVRTDAGFGAATMASSTTPSVSVGVGGLDFSTILTSEVPADSLVIQHISETPDGATMCGSAARPGDLRIWGPGQHVVGVAPAGIRATTLVFSLDAVECAAAAMCTNGVRLPSTLDSVHDHPVCADLLRAVRAITSDPRWLETPTGAADLIDVTAGALAADCAHREDRSGRGYDSRAIVADCIDFSMQSGRPQPSMSELCRAAMASQSRVRQAFVEVTGVPPAKFFQLRTLSRLRDDLVRADPDEASVTELALARGLTQLGRMAGRYRQLFGEMPSTTLARGGSPGAYRLVGTA